MIGSPDRPLWPQRLSPSWRRPLVLGKLAIMIAPNFLVLPSEKVAATRPLPSTEILVSWPAALPFWVIVPGVKVDDAWRVLAESARTIPVTEKTAIDAEIAQLGQPYDKETQDWLGRTIGESSEELTARDCRFRDSAIIDLIQRVQLEAGNADVSLAACFNPEARIPKGKVTVRNIAGLYEYENTLVTLELTGQQLKEALEHSAQYFREYEQGKSLAELIDQRVPGYNFDMAAGVTYDIDLTKPFGQRIQNLKFKGRPLAPEQKLRVVTNNYRVNGGGNYTMYKGAPVVYRSSEEVRELIIDWVEKHKTVPTQSNANWRIVGVG